MANIKSAKKRIMIAEENRLRNHSISSKVKTAIKRFETSEEDDTQALFRTAVREIDKAVTKGVLHRNTAARKKSRLSQVLKTKAQ